MTLSVDASHFKLVISHLPTCAIQHINNPKETHPKQQHTLIILYCYLKCCKALIIFILHTTVCFFSAEANGLAIHLWNISQNTWASQGYFQESQIYFCHLHMTQVVLITKNRSIGNVNLRQYLWVFELFDDKDGLLYSNKKSTLSFKEPSTQIATMF